MNGWKVGRFLVAGAGYELLYRARSRETCYKESSKSEMVIFRAWIIDLNTVLTSDSLSGST